MDYQKVRGEGLRDFEKVRGEGFTQALGSNWKDMPAFSKKTGKQRHLVTSMMVPEGHACFF